MSWIDRLKTARLISPSGINLPFSYENVSRSFTKRTTAYNFPDADGTFIQDKGRTGRRYPMRIFFWGADHDLEAETFENALSEVGIFKLEHPFYKTVDVVPFGEINRSDALKTAANQSVIEVQLWETTGLIFTTGQVEPSAVVVASILEYNKASALHFSEQVEIENASERATLKSRFTVLLDNVKTSFQKIADAQSNVKRLFDNTYDSINSTIDTLVGTPLTLASQSVIFLGAPARALTSIQARLDAYKNLAENLIGGDDAVGTPTVNTDPLNIFTVNEIYANTAVVGQIASVVNNQFETAPEAFEAADAILELSRDVETWRENNYASLSAQDTSIIDTGEVYQKLQESVALTLGFLVQLSFSLKKKRTITLDRDRTMIDLVAELFGEVDERLDFLMESNNFSGDEIFELKRGRTIEYYV